MDQLLAVPIHQSLPEETLNCLKNSGWQVTVAGDLVTARQILLQRTISMLLVEFSLTSQDPERMNLLRFVQQHCPATIVALMHSLNDEGAHVDGDVLTQAVNSMEDARHGVGRSLSRFQLSPAQERIADLVAQAWPNREIARRLKIKEQSVRNEISRIFRKVGVWNRVELALLINHRPRTADHSGEGHHNDKIIPAEAAGAGMPAHPRG